MLCFLQVEEKKAATEVLLEEMGVQRAGAGEYQCFDTNLATVKQRQPCPVPELTFLRKTQVLLGQPIYLDLVHEICSSGKKETSVREHLVFASK